MLLSKNNYILLNLAILLVCLFVYISFLIGNDGNVYEGRGWSYKPGPECTYRKETRDHTIQIGLIGGHEGKYAHLLHAILYIMDQWGLIFLLPIRK